MDVSIAVSLIRGQMGAVVERAVNGAVETVLAEMLKVVGVKFEELKAQVVLMKRDIAALQMEKALKEKENDNIRAKLRYTELKLKYYRQGVEEELQQRASTSALARIHPSTFHQAQRGGPGLSSPETSPSGSTRTRTSEAPLTRTNEGLFCPAEQDAPQSKDANQEDCEWTVVVQPHTQGEDSGVAPPPVLAPAVDQDQQPAAGLLSPDGSPQSDSSTLPSCAPQVKQEAEEVICIKEEPEDEQEVMANVLLDCKVEQGHPSEAQSSGTEWSGSAESQTSLPTAFSSAGLSSTYSMPQAAASLLSMAALPPGIPPRQAVRPWSKDLSLYEEYKLRRNELRRRNLTRRRELEKTLPQPLLADLVRERREKTRLRVARWRAKRKLQACVSQAQTLGGAAGLSLTGFPLSSQPQQPCASTSSSQQRQSPSSILNSSLSAANRISSSLPFKPSSSSTSLLLRGPNMAAPHQHTVTSSSSSSYPQISLLQQSMYLTEADTLQ